MSRQRGIGWRECLLALCAVLVALALAEGVARLLLPPTRYHDSPLEFDPVLGFRGVPGHRHPVRDHTGTHEFALNEDGFRGRPLPSAPAPPGVQRIALLGDSFLVGEVAAEEDLLATRLESLLSAAGAPVEVYNLGVTDYGTAQQLLLLERVAERVQPDLVVLALFTGNDIVNNWPGLAGTIIGSPGDPIRPYLLATEGGLRPTWVDPLRGAVLRRSRLFTFLERRLLARSVEWRDVSRGASRRSRLTQGRAPREQLEVLRQHPVDSPWEAAWQNSFALLRALHTRCQALGVPLRVLVIPHAYQVEHGAIAVRYAVEARTFARRSLDKLLDWNLPERRLAAFFEAEEIPAHMLLPALRSSAREARVYAEDEHWNERGHRVAADVLAQWLRSGEAQSTGEIAGAPVHMLAARGIGSRLDFRQAPQDAALGLGFLNWEPGEAGGWYTGPSALVALRPRRGDFVVRGTLPEVARLPVEGRFAYAGQPAERFTLSRHGPFELRFPWRPGSAAVDAEGFGAVMIAPGTTYHYEALPLGFVLHEVAFEPPGRDAMQ